MNKYYTLVLNNCYDLGIHYVSPAYCTIIPNVRQKKLTNLSSLEDEFMDLDDKITTHIDSFDISGGFPVIGSVKDGKMVDIISGKEIVYAANPRAVKGLSYSKMTPAHDMMVNFLLESLTKEEKQKYVAYIDRIEEYSKKNACRYNFKETYYLVTPTTIRVDSTPLIVKYQNGEYIELISKTKLVLVDDSTITSKLSFKHKHPISKLEVQNYILSLIENGLQEYMENIKIAKANAIREYNNYVSFNKDKDFAKIKRR